MNTKNSEDLKYLLKQASKYLRDFAGSVQEEELEHARALIMRKTAASARKVPALNLSELRSLGGVNG